MLRAACIVEPGVNSVHAGELKVKAMVRARSDEEGRSKRHLCVSPVVHTVLLNKFNWAGQYPWYQRSAGISRARAKARPFLYIYQNHISIYTGHKMMIKYIELKLCIKAW